jgi:hypothetical protein
VAYDVAEAAAEAADMAKAPSLIACQGRMMQGQDAASGRTASGRVALAGRWRIHASEWASLAGWRDGDGTVPSDSVSYGGWAAI